MMFFFKSLVVILYIRSVYCDSKVNKNLENSSSCQSGLREDNTNYIYCARQGLTKVPNFFSNSGPAVVNVIYDEIVLSDNLIHSIGQDSFSNNLKAKKLYLDQNPIAHIDQNAFDNVRNYLEEIYFDQKASSLETSKGLIESKNSVYDYYFDDQVNSTKADDLTIFDQPVIKKCSNLRVLSIKNYRIIELKEYMFTKLNKLEKLELVNLNLHNIDQLAFYGLEMSIQELNLDSNLLESVPSQALGSLKRLKKLMLSQNRIKSLHSNAFFKVSSSLSTLDLSYNYLEEIDENAFNGPIQNSLRTVLIQNNGLKWNHFVQILFNLHQLQELNIDFNKLSIQADFDYDDSQQVDYYSDVHLSLSSLSMQGNALTEKSIIAFGSLYDYEHSQLSSSTSYFRRKFKYGKLSRLNMARNKIKSLPNDFFARLNMSQLKTLVLDRNPFASKQFNAKSLSGLENTLETLSLNSVGLTLWSSNLLEALSILNNLKTLKLNGNNAGNTDKTLSNTQLLKSLNTIELQNNDLKELPGFVCNLENLIDLDLSSNKIKRLDSTCRLFKQDGQNKTKLKHFNLNNNPLECDCELKDLKIWLATNYNRDMLELIKWQCSQPARLRGRMLTNVGFGDLVCEKKNDREIDSSIQILIQNDDMKPTIELVKTTSETTTSISRILKGQAEEKLVIEANSTSLYKHFLIDDSKGFLNLLLVAISLSILIVMTLILITLYLVCVRGRTTENKEQYVKQFLFDNKRFLSDAPLFSLSSSSASSTTTSAGSLYAKSSTADLIDIFGSEYFSTMMPTREKSFSTNMNPSNTHYYDKPINSIFNMVKKPTALASSSSFSPQQQQEQQKDHIYHEINNDQALDHKVDIFFVKRRNESSINNENYLWQSSELADPEYNSLRFGNKNSFNFSNISRMSNFNDGLIV